MIRLTLEDNGTGHDDVKLTYPGGEHRCDSYYFAIDNNFEPDDESITKVRAVIRALLSQWLEIIEDADDHDTVFLPFDFSDECTGWIRCRLECSRAQLDIGWSGIEGWSFYPSDIFETARSMTDIYSIENSQPIAMDRELLSAVIKSNIEQYVESDG